MTIYLIAGIMAVAAFAGWSIECYKIGGDTRIASYEKKLAAADAKLVEAGEKAKQDAANHITDMQASFEVGEEQAIARSKATIAKGQSDVTTYPVFSNPACVLPDDSLRNLNAARAGLQPAADPIGTAAGLSAAGPAAGRKDSDAIPTGDQGRGTGGTMAGVHPPASATSAGGQVPGLGLQHPKPKAVD